jgi:hypothetical protein
VRPTGKPDNDFYPAFFLAKSLKNGWFLRNVETRPGPLLYAGGLIIGPPRDKTGLMTGQGR